MARIRSIKPEYFIDDEIASLPPLARILFIGLWCLADREGRLEDRPRKIKAAILPFDACDPESLLRGLEATRHIVRYEIGGKRCIWIPGFTKHQKPNIKELPSNLPPAPEGCLTKNFLDDTQHDLEVQEFHSWEGKGREQEREQGGNQPPSPSGASADKPPKVVTPKEPKKQTEAEREAHAWASKMIVADEPFVGNQHAARKALIKIPPEDRPAFERARLARTALGKGEFSPLHNLAQAGNWRRYLGANPSAVRPSAASAAAMWDNVADTLEGRQA